MMKNHEYWYQNTIVTKQKEDEYASVVCSGIEVIKAFGQ